MQNLRINLSVFELNELITWGDLMEANGFTYSPVLLKKLKAHMPSQDTRIPLSELTLSQRQLYEDIEFDAGYIPDPGEFLPLLGHHDPQDAKVLAKAGYFDIKTDHNGNLLVRISDDTEYS